MSTESWKKLKVIGIISFVTALVAFLSNLGTVVDTIVRWTISADKSVVNLVSPFDEEKKKKQLELYFLPHLSEQEFCANNEASSVVPGQKPYLTKSEIIGRTGNAKIGQLDETNGILRISCTIPLYADYVIIETGKKTKKGVITDADNLIVSVVFEMPCGDIQTIIDLEKIHCVSSSYNKDTGRWFNEWLEVREAFESGFLYKKFRKQTKQ